jgi:hypothetical protein
VGTLECVSVVCAAGVDAEVYVFPFLALFIRRSVETDPYSCDTDGAAAEETELVQVVLSTSEIVLVKELAMTPAEGWVSSQDAMSSYWISLMRLCGVEIGAVLNSVNVSLYFPLLPSFFPC